MHPHIHKLAIFGLITLFIFSLSSFLLPRRASPSLDQEVLENQEESPIYNRTLGFQEVFALALPDRRDRTLPLLDAANATNITITVLDAVRDKQIAKESWPSKWAEDRQTQEGELGCLMSHLRTWKKIVAERITTALVMESDSDWDMRVKDIMANVAEGVEAIADWPFTPTNDTERFGPPMDPSPYGPNWDIIWIGHCGSSNHGNGRYYAMNDSSVPPEPQEHTFGSPPQDEQHRPGTRMVFQQSHTVCSTAYGISYAGAVKLVGYFKEATQNLDLELSAYCRDSKDLSCLGVWPQVITAASTRSNIDHPQGEVAPGQSDAVEVHPGPGLQYSARINAGIVQQGLGRESWHPEWNYTFAMVHDEWKEISFEDLQELEEVQRWDNAAKFSNSTTNETRSW